MKTSLIQSVKWCVAVVGLSLATIASANLVKNSDFKDDLLDWKPPVGEVSHDGTVGASEDGTAPSLGAAWYNGAENDSGELSQNVGKLFKTSTYALQFVVKEDELPNSPKPALTMSLGENTFEQLFGRATDPEAVNGVDDSGFSGEFWFYYFTDFTGVDFGDENVFLKFSFSGAGQSWVDNVILECLTGCDSTRVPEPGSLLLVGAALAGLGVVRRRKSA